MEGDHHLLVPQYRHRKHPDCQVGQHDDGRRQRWQQDRHYFLQTWGHSLLFGFILLMNSCENPTEDPVTKSIKKLQLPKLAEDAEPGPERNPLERLKFRPYWLVVPSMLDLIATSLMYIGLTMTTASR